MSEIQGTPECNGRRGEEEGDGGNWSRRREQSVVYGNQKCKIVVKEDALDEGETKKVTEETGAEEASILKSGSPKSVEVQGPKV